MSRWARYRLLEYPRACLLTFFLLIACFLPRRERRYKCFLDSKEEEKGSDCIESFRAMQECFSQHPEHYKVFFRLCLSSHPSAHASHAHTHTHTQEFLDGPEDEGEEGEEATAKSDQDKRREAQEWQLHSIAPEK